MVEELLRQDPDLESARFQILDFSSPSSKEHRQLKVIEASEVPRLDSNRKKQMLEVFVDGYYRAIASLSRSTRDTTRRETEIIVDPNQIPLWQD